MKNFMKGLITGIILTIILCAVPVLAQNGEFLFNDIDGADRVQWGQDDTLSDGRTIPYSIVYNDTTYLPMRRVSEMNGKQIYWNGDSKTASMTGIQKEGSQEIYAQKPDKNGNVWTYYTFETEDGNSYLGVKDENRGYERVYRRADESYVGVTEDELYFIRLVPDDGTDKESVYRIYFLNDENSQDGEVFDVPDEVVFDGEYIYYNFHMDSTNAHEVIYSYNIHTQETYQTLFYCSNWGSVDDFKLKEKREDGTTVLSCKFLTTGPTFQGEITFDRNTNMFSDPVHEIEI